VENILKKKSINQELRRGCTGDHFYSKIILQSVCCFMEEGENIPF